MHHFRDWYSPPRRMDFGWVHGGPSRTGGRRENNRCGLDRRATKHPAKIHVALRFGAAPRRVAGSLNRTSAILLASALRVIRRRSQSAAADYTSHGSGVLVALRRLVRFREIKIVGAVPVMVPYPVTQVEPGTRLVATLGRQIQAYVRADQFFGSTTIG
jgi:hypothetical protein